MERILTYCDFGLIDYKEAWDLQREILGLRYKKKITDILLLLEHPNTYTFGKTADKKNLTGTETFLSSNKISIYDIDRGGDITYHGPGQIVGYPIIDLNEWEKDTHKFLRALEEVLISTCERFGIKAGRNPGFTGVWINSRKIAAIGIKISRWITMHGFAFNVNTNLDLFKGIIPCGIPDKEVTSLQRELNREADLLSVKNIILENFLEIFGYKKIIRENKETIIESVLASLQ